MKEGVFWVIPKDGASDQQFRLIVNFNSTAGHAEIWETVIREHRDLAVFDYEHFPRGRVWTNNGTATVFLDPRINSPAFLDAIKRAFGLDDRARIFGDGPSQNP